jgi:2-succinyl-5-enolpyruvyl-6-hydroxy-3-cyclohexene-1-carboxylate synthase
VSTTEHRARERRAAEQWAWARLLLDGLAAAGVRDVVISPGSRSSPFVLAAHEHAGLRCHDILDERSAAFFALGQAKACGEPSLLICTSGTAGAHYLPAVMEASQSHTSLIVLTADRPFELQECGANQTADQLKLFGPHVRRFFHLGRPDSSERSLRALRRVAAQAVSIALRPVPGPVHLNAPARKPLEPPAATDEASEDGWLVELEARYRRALASRVTRVAAPPSTVDGKVVGEVADRIRAAARPLMICGPATLAQRETADDLFHLCAVSAMPVGAEATSQLRLGVLDGALPPRFAFFDPVYRSESGRVQLRPDLIVQIGGAPTSGGLLQLAAELAGAADAHRIAVAPYGWPDPESSADLLIQADPGAFARAVSDALSESVSGEGTRGPDDVRSNWTSLLERADTIVRRAIEDELAEAGDLLTEGAVAREVVRATPEAGLLALGNSLPVRQVDAWCEPGLGPARVLSQRGLSGIDGLVSGAAGAAGRLGVPTTLLLGDLSFLHDLNGLQAALDLEVSFVIVVVNNAGGRIFEELPIAGRVEFAASLSHFTTPHEAALEHAAALYGHRYATAETVGDLGTELDRALSTAGCTVVEARVPAHGAAEQNGRIRNAVDRGLRALDGS